MNRIAADAKGGSGDHEIERSLHLELGEQLPSNEVLRAKLQTTEVAEDSFCPSVELFQQALKGTPLVIEVQDEQLRFRWFYNASPSLHDEMLLGKRDSDIMVRPEEARRIQALIRHVLETGAELKEEMVVFDGQDERHYDWRAKPFVTGGRISGILCTACDLTRHVESAQLLRAAEERASRRAAELAAIYATVPIGLAVFDDQLRYVYINDCLAEINGLPASAHIGRTIREMVPDLADGAEARFSRILQTGEPLLNFEVTGETAHQPGVRRTWLEQAYPIKNERGQAVAINLVVEEITERKQAEAEREQQLKEIAHKQARLQELNETLEQQVARRTEQLRQLALDLLRAEQQERSRLAMELHDSAGQLLTVLTLNLQMIANDIPGELVELQQQLHELAQLTVQTHEEIRAISHSMHPIALKNADLDNALESLAHDFARRTAIEVEYQGVAALVDDDVALAYYRFLQETLANVARHAQASCVWVALGRNDGILTLSVRDDGVGFEIQTNTQKVGGLLGGMGLQNLHQRFQFLGGQVTVESQKEGGTRVEAQLKLES